MRLLSSLLFLVRALTSGTIISEIAIADTPISGDLAAAEEKPLFKEITKLEMPTVKSPEMIPENAPILVIFFENKPQM